MADRLMPSAASEAIPEPMTPERQKLLLAAALAQLVNPEPVPEDEKDGLLADQKAVE